jgi:hypothetical protein
MDMNMRNEKIQALELAKQIIRLDLLRDEMLERLELLAGRKTFELLRYVQNHGFSDSSH